MRELPEDIYSQLVAANVRMGLDTEMAQWSALEAIEILCESIGGQQIYWPRSTRARELRDARIRQARDAGVDLDSIAKRHGLTKGRVSQICQG